MAFKNPLGLADELTREARKNTLNKRINYKGNYENYITGGSRALNNQNKMDRNEYAVSMDNPESGWAGEEWLQKLNNRYTNPVHNRKAGNSPVGSGLNYIHDQTPSTKRGRRISDIFFQKKRNPYGVAEDGTTWQQIQKIVNKYEGR